MFKDGAIVWFVDNELKIRYGKIINVSNNEMMYNIEVHAVGPKNIIISEIFENIEACMIFRNEVDAIKLQKQLLQKFS